jgi:hypothetical protein
MAQALTNAAKRPLVALLVLADITSIGHAQSENSPHRTVAISIFR